MNGSTIGWTLAPDATHATEFYTASDGPVVLTLDAVLLKDGSGDGDPKTLSRLKEVRDGSNSRINKSFRYLAEFQSLM